MVRLRAASVVASSVLALSLLMVPAAPVSAAGSGTLADPYVIGTLPATIEVDLGTARSGYGSLSCNQGVDSLWVATITVPTPTSVTIDTGGSDFDTVLELSWTDDNGSPRSTCSDDSARAGGLTSHTDWTLEANTTYYVVVSAYTLTAWEGGHLVLHVSDRQQITATISTPTVGSLIGGTVACYPGAISLSALTGSVTINGEPTPFNVAGCTASGMEWSTGTEAKKGKSYKVVATISVASDSYFRVNGSLSFEHATTTVSAKVKTK
jgi:hypothetical protein